MNGPLVVASAILLVGLLGAVDPPGASADDADPDSDPTGDASERPGTVDCSGRDGRDGVDGQDGEDGVPGGDCGNERGDGLDDATA